MQERRGVEGRPLQITVTALDNDRDTEYIVRRDLKIKGDELVTYLQRHLMIYTKFSEMKQKELIDYVALSQGADEYRRSNTLTVDGPKEGALSKKAIG